MTGRTINNGLKMLLSDKDVLDMIDQLPPSRVVDIYIEPVSPLLMMQTQDSSTDKAGLSGPSDKAGPNGPSDKVGPPDIGLGPNLNYEDLLFDDGDLEDGDLEDVDIGDVDSSESDASFFEDSDYAQSDDDELFEAFVDDGIEWEGLGKNKGKEKEVNEEVNMEVDDGEDYGDVSSEDLHSVYSDSDDEVKDKNPEFRAETDMGKVKFCPGMKFSNAKEFREAVREYAIKKGKGIKFVKNETTRIKAICAAEECPWSIMGSLAQKGESFQVKTYKKKHKCLRSFRVRHVTSMYLANKYVDSIRSNPNMPLEHLQERVRKDIVVNVSTTQAYRAKRKALDLIEGTHMEQYALLRDYCEEVRRTNPNTTIIINTIPPPTEDGQPTFERLYICLGALKQGMLSGCRRLVCMDACHLKRSHGGQLLVGMGIDANNQSFPFAYAVVESETKDSWIWKWDLKGIPCTHAITAITHKHANIEDYIDSCYKKETNASIYRGIIYPINGRNMWHASGCVPILPPNYGRSSGRPKKCRRKERAELENPDPDKLRRQNTSLRCGKCGQWGHNMRTCKNEANPEIRRRPTGGLVFTRPSGRPRGRPRRGGVQSTFGRGRGAVGDGAAPQSSQVSVGTDGAAPQATQASQVSVGTVGIDGGRTRGGRGMGTDGGGTRGGRGRGRSIGGSSGGSTDVGRGSGGGNKGGRTGGGRGRAGRGSGVGTRGGSTDGGRGRTGRGRGRPIHFCSVVTCFIVMHFDSLPVVDMTDLGHGALFVLAGRPIGLNGATVFGLICETMESSRCLWCSNPQLGSILKYRAYRDREMSLLRTVGGLVWEIVSTTVVTYAVPWLSEFVSQRILPLWQRYWPVIYQSVLVPAYHLVSDTIPPLLHDLLSNHRDSSAVSTSESPPRGTSFESPMADYNPESNSENFLKQFCIPNYILVPDSEIEFLPVVPTWPILVFINSKSGGQLGGDLLVTYRSLLNKNQVVDLLEEAPDTVLHRLYLNLEKLKLNGDELSPKIQERLRIIVAGGDGTAGWLLGVVSDLKLSPPPPITTVPLGTENILPFSFGWGKKNPGTDRNAVESFLRQVTQAKEMKIDSWHILMRMRAPAHGSCDPIAPLELPHSLHAFHWVASTDTLNKVRESALPFTDAMSHDDENVLSVEIGCGEGCHTFRGGFWNYFSMVSLFAGMDAQASYAFHSERKSNPKKFKNQLSNQLVQKASTSDLKQKNIAQLAKVKIMKKHGEWLDLPISQSIRSIVCLNLPSFSGGLNPWGTPNTKKRRDRGLTPPFVDDGLIEVVGFRDAWHGLVLFAPNGHGTRLAQAHRIRFEFHKGAADHTFMTIDGEPWKQPLPVDDDTVVVEISHHCQVTVLATHDCRSKSVFDPSWPTSNDSDGDSSEDDAAGEEWRKFGAADTFKIPDKVDISHLS
ncbi:hypothetical protein RHGRI_033621 [Rhododendron griersonianum]|uniref:Diacylglycerol kinase n=1 Tax=Rhododendron griersonianum TaxID=479676 RepID=A0AAV6HXH2_9ERIC|nr:hypothetical protein RHGRI_033621 [Rhododendron griersonianum]